MADVLIINVGEAWRHKDSDFTCKVTAINPDTGFVILDSVKHVDFLTFMTDWRRVETVPVKKTRVYTFLFTCFLVCIVIGTLVGIMFSL